MSGGRTLLVLLLFTFEFALVVPLLAFVDFFVLLTTFLLFFCFMVVLNACTTLIWLEMFSS
jgi:hypothetical protein